MHPTEEQIRKQARNARSEAIFSLFLAGFVVAPVALFRVYRVRTMVAETQLGADLLRHVRATAQVAWIAIGFWTFAAFIRLSGRRMEVSDGVLLIVAELGSAFVAIFFGGSLPNQGDGDAERSQWTHAPGQMPDGTICNHEGETSNYCTRCWAALNPGVLPQSRRSESLERAAPREVVVPSTDELLSLALTGDLQTLGTRVVAVLSIFPKNADALYWHAFVEHKNGTDRASELYRVASAPTFYKVADLWAKKGRLEEAESTLLALREAHPEEIKRATKALTALRR
jgi:hypothetical protein